MSPQTRGFPGGSDGKESACNVGDPGLIPGSGRSCGKGTGNPLWYSCLENSMGSGVWWTTVHGVAKSWARLSNEHFPFQTMKQKQKINKWNYIKLNSFYILKKTINKMKRQPTKMEENICKWYTTKNSQNSTPKNKKWAEDLHRYFSKDIQISNRHKKHSTLLIIREIQMKTTLRYLLTPVKMAIIEHLWECGEKGKLMHCW